MRVIAAIDDPRVVEKSLRHLALWHDPPPNSPPGPAGVLARQPGMCFRGPLNGSDRRFSLRQVKSRGPVTCPAIVRRLIEITSRQQQTQRTLLDWPRSKMLTS